MSDIKSGTGIWYPLDTGLDEGEREFVVGDVHGHGFELGELLTSMRRACGESAAHARLTFLGDLIDRGPCSISTVRLAAAAEVKFGFKSAHMLLGNHETMMIAALGLVRGTTGADIQDAYQIWNYNGGDRVLDEVGERLPGRFPVSTPRHFRELMNEAFGQEGMNFLLSGMTHRRTGRLLLCHAGVDPGAVGLDEWFSTPPWPVVDMKQNWAWARENAWGHEGVFQDNVVVVHGHTPEISILQAKGRIAQTKNKEGAFIPVDIAQVARLDGSRIGLDGGSYATGVVMGAEFIKGAYRLHFGWNSSMLLNGSLCVGAEVFGIM